MDTKSKESEAKYKGVENFHVVKGLGLNEDAVLYQFIVDFHLFICSSCKEPNSIHTIVILFLLLLVYISFLRYFTCMHYIL